MHDDYVGQRLESEAMILIRTLANWFSKRDCLVGMEKWEMAWQNTTLLLAVQTSTKCAKLNPRNMLVKESI